MQVWLISFVVLFALYECWDWFSQLDLPLPVFVVGGLFLAIVSNYDKRGLFPGWPAPPDPGGEATDGITEPESQPKSQPGPKPEPLAQPPGTGIAPSQTQPLDIAVDVPTPPVIKSPRLPFE
jgi:hypothetical protein